MKPRKLTAKDVVFSLQVEADDLEMRGNALASGDDAEDKACEAEILARLDRGDVWAWCVVTVTASWRNFSGSDNLGGCSYESEADFRQGPYYKDMCDMALAALNRAVADAAASVATLERRGSRRASHS